MEFQQLRYFTAVSKHRNFTRAAEACRVSQPALSIQIQKLEAELGGPLFHRQGRRISLTSIGERLLEKAEAMLLLHQSSLDEMKDAAREGGEARFGAILTIAPYLIPFVVGQSGETNASAIRMEENFTEKLVAKLLDGTLDFAIMSTPVEEPKLLVKVIAREPFVVVMPSGHPLAKKEKVALEEVLEESFLPLSRIHCAGQQISDFCQSRLSQVEAKFECSQIDTILKLVKRGQGVSLLPQMAVADSLSEGLCYRQLKGGRLTRDISMVYHPDRYISNSVRQLMDRIEVGLSRFVER